MSLLERCKYGRNAGSAHREKRSRCSQGGVVGFHSQYDVLLKKCYSPAIKYPLHVIHVQQRATYDFLLCEYLIATCKTCQASRILSLDNSGGGEGISSIKAWGAGILMPCTFASPPTFEAGLARPFCQDLECKITFQDSVLSLPQATW